MKQIRIIAVLIIIFFSEICNAQKIHEIVFCNTIDRRIGESVAVDNDRALEEIGTIGGYIGYEVKEYVYPGENCTKQNLYNVINALQCGNNDIIFFYYSGHGVHANGGFGDLLPQMCMNTNLEQNFVPVRSVVDILKKKNARLTIVMTDCCNNIDESNVVSVKSGDLSGAKGVTVIKSQDVSNYRKLFVEASGCVVATSSKLGQTSGCAKFTDGSEAGGYFSYTFWESLYKKCKENGSLTWNGIMTDIKQLTLERTGQKQEPYYIVNVNTQNAVSSGSAPTPPSPSPTSQASTTSLFSQALAVMLSTSDMDTRVNNVSSIINNCFGGNNATVITVGRNVRTILDYEDAETFLNRIATTSKVVRINVIREVRGNDGKFYITVQEMRTE